MNVASQSREVRSSFEERIMTRYFMNLRDGTEELIDPEGIDYPSMDSLRTAVLAAARDVMCGDMRRGVLDLRFRIDAEDKNGVIVYSLPFKHAFSLIPEAA
jgi:hypothetical protein